MTNKNGRTVRVTDMDAERDASMTNFKCIYCGGTTGWRFLDCATCKMMEIDCTAKVCCDCGADT